jgi:hypothetical protein
MGIIGKLYRALNALYGRTKIGALQGGLIFNLKNSGVDSPRSKQLIAQIALVAWKIRIISEFFQNLEFSFEDYEIMYSTAIIASPNILIQEKSLVATFLMIDNYNKFGPRLHTIAQAISGTAGDERKNRLANLITLTVKNIEKRLAGK